MSSPFFTIITATYNAASTLPRLLESLAAQTCRDFELVIQDGASSDDTVAVAESYRHRLPALSLVSEPDTGIYDAWNKALARVRGEWVLFLGADDALYASDVLVRCKAAMQESVHSRGMQTPLLFVAGDIAITAQTGQIIRFLSGRAIDSVNRLQAGEIPTPFPGLFTHHSVFRRYKFDPSWRIAGDYDFLCRSWTQIDMGTTIPILVTDMRDGGISSQPSYASICFKETCDIAQKHFGNSWTFARRYQYARSCIVSFLYKYFPKRAPALHSTFRKIYKEESIQKPIGQNQPIVPFNPAGVPVFIISYNRISYLKSIVTWLESYGLNNIIIVDNNSTYPPLLEYLRTTPHRVERISENLGHLVVWKCGHFDDILRKNYYIITDPDILPDENCPHDAVLRCYNMLQKYPNITKSGFSLKIDDLPAHSPFRNAVIETEKKYWTKPTPDGEGYFAPIDTTFALYRPGIFPDDEAWFEGVRLAPPYIARHAPWYENPTAIDDEILSYQRNAKPEASMWSVHDTAILKQENMHLKERVLLLEKQVDLLSRSWGNQVLFIFFKVLRHLKHKLFRH